MTLRALAVCFFANSLIACVPKESDPTITDLDGDGVFDTWDQCMADPEDMDGFEDGDGCPEDGELAEGADVTGGTSNGAIEADIETEEARIRRSRKKPLKTRSTTARVSANHEKAGGIEIDKAERASLVLGFGKVWVKEGKKSRRINGNVTQASFSPDGRHVGLVSAKALFCRRCSIGQDRESLCLRQGNGKRDRDKTHSPSRERRSSLLRWLCFAQRKGGQELQ